MPTETRNASQIAVRFAIAFLAVIVVAPPILIALCFVPESWTRASLVILLLMFALIGAAVVRAEEVETAIVRALFLAGVVLIVVPIVMSLSAVFGGEGNLLSSVGAEDAGALRKLLLVYDVAIGAACWALASVIWLRVRSQEVRDPTLADAELRQAFFEVRQLVLGRA